MELGEDVSTQVVFPLCVRLNVRAWPGLRFEAACKWLGSAQSSGKFDTLTEDFDIGWVIEVVRVDDRIVKWI